jgi:hypothetical protein
MTEETPKNNKEREQMVVDTLDTRRGIRVPYGHQERRKVSDYLESTDTVQGLDPAEIYEQDNPRTTPAFQLMLASQDVLAKDWNRPEEDEAWAYLSKER